MINKKYQSLTVIVTLFVFISFSEAQDFVPGKAYRNNGAFVEYLCGNMPLLISVPHGGYEKPPSIPERTGRFAKNQDIYTIEIAYEIYQNIFEETGKYPHIVINHLHRTRLDANRNIREAADGNEDAERVWNEYQHKIDSVSTLIQKKYEKGLFIDLHGHRHTIERIELGYLLSSDELQMGDELLNSGLLDEYTSIRSLLKCNEKDLSFTELLNGEFSFGSMLNKRGQPCMPSPENKIPIQGEPYFRGGYNTTRHGSSNGGTLDGIQIEMDLQTRTDKKRQLEVAEDIASALVEYISVHYFPK